MRRIKRYYVSLLLRYDWNSKKRSLTGLTGAGAPAVRRYIAGSGDSQTGFMC